MNALQFYVYYKIEPARVEETRVLVDALFREVLASTGIRGEWQRRRDDPSTFMEIYRDVPGAAVAFEKALQAALAKVGFPPLVARKTEVFQCA